MDPTIARLRDAMNAHDLEAFVAQFSPDYKSSQPIHPRRGFGGRDRVRKNWTAILAAADRDDRRGRAPDGRAGAVIPPCGSPAGPSGARA